MLLYILMILPTSARGSSLFSPAKPVINSRPSNSRAVLQSTYLLFPHHRRLLPSRFRTFRFVHNSNEVSKARIFHENKSRSREKKKEKKKKKIPGNLEVFFAAWSWSSGEMLGGVFSPLPGILFALLHSPCPSPFPLPRNFQNSTGI